MLGMCYYNGKGVAEDYAEAVNWFRKAADQGDVYAQYNLGYSYYQGECVTQDYAEAVNWLRKAAEQGHKKAQNLVGECYDNGKGITQDYAEAVKWYRMAAEQEDAKAQYNLGNCYYNGKGVTQDYAEAVKWYRMAAEQGNTDAQFKLGDCYKNGEGVTKDHAEAEYWHNKAKEQCLSSISSVFEQIPEKIRQGQIALEGGDYREAIRLFEYLKEIYEVIGEKNEVFANLLKKLAFCYSSLGDYAKAVELGTQAVEIRREALGEKHPDYATSLSNLAGYYDNLGDYAKAVELGTQALEIRREVLGEKHPDHATSLNNLASYYSSLGDYAKAVELATQAVEIHREVLGEKHPNYATSLNNLASYYSSLGDYAKAVELGTQAVEIRREVLGEKHPDFATSLSNLAGYYFSLGDYVKAVELGTQTVEILREVLGEKHPDYATSLSNLATYYSSLGDYAKAVELGTQALEIRREVLGEKHPDYAHSLNNLATYYSSLGDYAKAVELGTQALEISREELGEKHPDYATSLSNLANYYSSLGDYAKAVELGTQAMEISREVLGEKHPDYASILSSLANYYYYLGNYAKAVELGTQAVEIRREVLEEKHPGYANSLSNLASYYDDLGDYAKAVELTKQALEIYREVLGEKHPDYATSLNNLSTYYYSLGDYAKAVELGAQALEIRRKVLGEKHPDYATSLSNLAICYSNLAYNTKALSFYSQNISIIQNNARQQFAGLTASQRTNFWKQYSYKFTDVYPSFTFKSQIKSAPDLYDKSALFAKGLLLSTEIEMNRLIQESGDEEALRIFEKLQTNRLQLQKLYETPIAERRIDTDSLAQVVNKQELALVKRSQAYGDFTRKLQTTWQEVQGALKEDEIAVEFLSFNVWGTDSTMVAALTLRKDDKEPKFIPLFEQKQLKTVSDTTYYHCPELTALVWQPLQQELQGIKRIYFSPAGALHNIGIEYAPGMEEYEMYRLSTTREIIETHPRPLPKGGEVDTQPDTHPGPLPKGGEEEAVLYGGVDYDASVSSGTPPSEKMGEVSIALHRAFIDSLDIRGAKAKIQKLPGTKVEVEDIKRSFDNNHRPSTLHTGADATETSVKVISGTRPCILHIATHGFYFTDTQAQQQSLLRTIGEDESRSAADLEDKALTRSGLLMAGVNVLKDKDLPMEADDGILTAQEISRLDLRGLDLVVLSACQTGKGDINQGEGVFGLQRGFKKAGAQTLVMSLWNVDDNATQIIMTAFYDNLLQGQSKRDAFHNAQQHLRTVDNGRYNEPQYWAAFILLD